MPEHAFVARSPFGDLSSTTSDGSRPGLIISARDGLGLATVMVRRGQLEALKRRIGDEYGVELPGGNFRTEARGVAFLGLGPESWLASCEFAGNEFAVSLQESIGAPASISDQSDGYAVLRLSGSKVREMLAKLIPIDVHPRAFRPGDVASTVASHMGVTLWRLHDAADGSPVFEMAVFRSFAAAFWHALSESAAEFGLFVTK